MRFAKKLRRYVFIIPESSIVGIKQIPLWVGVGLEIF